MPKGYPKNLKPRTFKLTRVGEPLQPNDWPEPIRDVIISNFIGMIEDLKARRAAEASQTSP